MTDTVAGIEAKIEAKIEVEIEVCEAQWRSEWWIWAMPAQSTTHWFSSGETLLYFFLKIISKMLKRRGLKPRLKRRYRSESFNLMKGLIS